MMAVAAMAAVIERNRTVIERCQKARGFFSEVMR